MTCYPNTSSFLLLFGWMRCVMIDNLRLLLSFTQFYWFYRELCSVCAYVSPILHSFSNIICGLRVCWSANALYLVDFLEICKILGDFSGDLWCVGRIYRLFFLLYGHICHVMIDILRLLLIFNGSVENYNVIALIFCRFYPAFW